MFQDASPSKSQVLTILLALLQTAASPALSRDQSLNQLLAQVPLNRQDKEKASRDIAVFTKQIAAGDKTWSTYYKRACAYNALNRYDEALADAKEAMKLGPKQVDPVMLCATIHEVSLEDDEVVKDVTLAMKLSTPEQRSLLYYRRARAYEGVPRNDLALQDMLEYLKGHKERYDINIARSLGNMYLKAGKPAEAVEHLSYCLKINPKTAKVHEARADAYMQLKNYKAAISDLTFEIKRFSTVKPALYEKRAKAYRLDGQLKLAAQDDASLKNLDSEAFKNAPFRN
jgi:tetratricopeptide (TPR) repeat protein